MLCAGAETPHSKEVLARVLEVLGLSEGRERLEDLGLAEVPALSREADRERSPLTLGQSDTCFGEE